MKRTIATGIGLAVGILVALGIFAVAGRTAPERQPYGPPIGPKMAPDTGAGEMLVLVVGGAYQSLEEAEAANARMPFGDLAGYYAVPVDQFQGLREQLATLGTPGEVALVSAFRTDLGAQQFAGFTRSFGHPATILVDRVLSLGGVYAGLGQEANASGTGPVTGPVPASLP
jgi:hypothetical protein